MIPVIIGGCPRSGTTLLGNMLGAADSATCTPESQFLRTYLTGTLPLNTGVDAEEVLKHIGNHKRFLFWGMPFFTDSYLKRFRAEPSISSLISLLINSYAEFLGQPKPRFWIDHTPSNLKYVEHWKKSFPNAMFINIIRDGRAVANSIMKLDWGPNTIIDSSRFWHHEVSCSLASEKLLGEMEIVRVKYENLVLDPEGELRRICEYTGITFQDGMLEPGLNFKMPFYTRSQHKLVSEQIDHTRIDAWIRNLSRKQIERFEAISGELLEHLGYKCQSPWNNRKISLDEQVLSAIYEKVKKRMNLKRERRRARKAIAKFRALR